MDKKVYVRHMFGVLKVFLRDAKTRKLEEIGRLSTQGVTADTIEAWVAAILAPYQAA